MEQWEERKAVPGAPAVELATGMVDSVRGKHRHRVDDVWSSWRR